jgi:hypothetical protein
MLPECLHAITFSYPTFKIIDCCLLIGPIEIKLFPGSIWCSSQCPGIGSSMLYHCRLYVSQRSLIAKIASNWDCRYQGNSVMLLRERLGTQFNNCSVPDRSLDFRPPSPPDVFPIDIHSSNTFPFPDPLLGSNTWIIASGLFNLRLNHLKRNKISLISFVHFPGSSS